MTAIPHRPDAESLARLVDALAEAVVIADSDGVITYWNHAATRLFGWTVDEAVGQSLDLIIPEPQRARHWAGYRQVMATGHTRYGDQLLEVPARHRDGGRLSIAFTVTLLFADSEQQPSAIAAVLRDDTERWQERKRMTQELARLRDGQAE